MGNCVPFFHVWGLSSALAVMAIGGTLVFPANNGKESSVGFDPKQLLQSMRQIDGDGCENNGKRIEERKDIYNTLVVVPAMVHSLWYEYQSLQKQNISYPYVQLLLVGGQNLTIPQLQYSKTMFPRARIVQTYACTAAGSSITFATVGVPNGS
jgi:acyl-CoA synthetase (AMP-forming)/AMP-acid ligase II